MSQIYTPSEHLTTDEMLVEFHGRVSFRQYIPLKPGRFGLKLFWVAKAESATTTTTVYFNEVVFPSVLELTSPMAFPQHSPPS